MSGTLRWIGREVQEAVTVETALTIEHGTATRTTTILQPGAPPGVIERSSGPATLDGNRWQLALRAADGSARPTTCTQRRADVAPAGTTLDCSSTPPTLSASTTSTLVWSCEPADRSSGTWMAAEPGIELVMPRACGATLAAMLRLAR